MPRFTWNVAFSLGLIALMALGLANAMEWPAHARIVPLAAGVAALLFAAGTLITEAFARPRSDAERGIPAEIAHMMDGPALDMGGHGEAARVLKLRALRFFLWLAAMLAAMAVVGVLPGLFLAMLAITWLEFGERLAVAATLACSMSLAFWLVFDRVFSTPWPYAVAGDIWPWLRSTTHLL